MKITIIFEKDKFSSARGILNSSHINQTLDIMGNTLSAESYENLLIKIEEIKNILSDS